MVHEHGYRHMQLSQLKNNGMIEFVTASAIILKFNDTSVHKQVFSHVEFSVQNVSKLIAIHFNTFE